MGRKRINEDLLKMRISVRLEKGDVDKIRELGTIQEIIEKAVKKYLEEICKNRL